ncbi:MAG: APC family permease [Chloroflexi bacterium]|nr:MAG: APC family permease [Chloroflexota bacterium]
MTGSREDEPPRTLVRGSRRGDDYVRIRREDLGVFRRTGRGYLVATEEASQPAGTAARLAVQVRDALLGRPLDSEAIESERLSVLKALPILSSDALSSVAYGPEAALAVLAVAGAGALLWNVPIAIAIAVLMLVVTVSYQQVIRGHPSGGGSYAVARANLGTALGLVAAAALLVDYVLTVSVSVSSGVDAIISPFQGLMPYRAEISVAVVAILMLGNLRGVREAGALFAVPTYLFLVAMLVLIAAGLGRAALGEAPHPGQYPPLPALEPLTPLLVLAAFASGCSSMTGIEAVSNAVPGFEEPRVPNAVRTLAILGALLILLFVGVEALDVLYAAAPQPGGSPTVLSQIAAAVFTGPGRWLYYGVQFSTTLVLVLAANTSFNGLPRLCAILARDDFLPHQLAQLGNRLVYSGAIMFLAIAATVLLLAFAGNTGALINLFALGVFTAFSLAQTAMVRHWWTRREPGWRRGWRSTRSGRRRRPSWTPSSSRPRRRTAPGWSSCWCPRWSGA